MNDSKFYDLLKSAQNNNDLLVEIIDLTMPMINNESKRELHDNSNSVKYYIDENLKSELTEYLIILIKSDCFADKLKNPKNK